MSTATEDRARELEHLREKLSHQVAEFDNGGGKLTDHQQLTIEAFNYAKLGDLDECKHRMRLNSQPKFKRLFQCQAAYAQAMKEKRGRECAA